MSKNGYFPYSTKDLKINLVYNLENVGNLKSSRFKNDVLITSNYAVRIEIYCNTKTNKIKCIY